MIGTYCNICGIRINLEQQAYGGYIHDNLTDSEDFDLCEECFEKLINSLIPQCKYKPFQDVEEYDDQDESDDSSDYDFDGELN